MKIPLHLSIFGGFLSILSIFGGFYRFLGVLDLFIDFCDKNGLFLSIFGGFWGIYRFWGHFWGHFWARKHHGGPFLSLFRGVKKGGFRSQFYDSGSVVRLSRNLFPKRNGFSDKVQQFIDWTSMRAQQKSIKMTSFSGPFFCPFLGFYRFLGSFLGVFGVFFGNSVKYP